MKKKTSQSDFAYSDLIAVSMEILENWLETLERLLKEHYHDSFGSANKVRFLPIEVSTSAFVPLAATADFDTFALDKCVVYYPEKDVQLQSVVASEPFGSSKKTRFDSIMVRTEKREPHAGLGQLQSNSCIQTTVWFHCALSFFKLLAKTKEGK